MDKGSLYTYGFVIIAIIMICSLLVIVGPLAKNNIKQTDELVSDVLVSANDFSEKPSEGDFGTVTIDFVFSDHPSDNPLKDYPNKVRVRMGEKYSIQPPQVNGYDTSVNEISDILYGDKTYTVSYFPVNGVSALVKVHYQFNDDTSKNYTSEYTVTVDKEYCIDVPSAEGYTPEAENIIDIINSDEITTEELFVKEYTIIYNS